MLPPHSSCTCYINPILAPKFHFIMFPLSWILYLGQKMRRQEKFLLPLERDFYPLSFISAPMKYSLLIIESFQKLLRVCLTMYQTRTEKLFRIHEASFGNIASEKLHLVRKTCSSSGSQTPGVPRYLSAQCLPELFQTWIRRGEGESRKKHCGEETRDWDSWFWGLEKNTGVMRYKESRNQDQMNQQEPIMLLLYPSS